MLQRVFLKCGLCGFLFVSSVRFLFSESRITPNQRYECRLGIPRITRMDADFKIFCFAVLFMGLCGLVVLQIADHADSFVAAGVCLGAMRHKLTVYATKMCDLERFTSCGTTWKGYATKRHNGITWKGYGTI